MSSFGEKYILDSWELLDEPMRSVTKSIIDAVDVINQAEVANGYEALIDKSLEMLADALEVYLKAVCPDELYYCKWILGYYHLERPSDEVMAKMESKLR